MPVASRVRVRVKVVPKPESDPRFRKVMDDLKRGAARTKTHPAAAKKAAEAGAAAKGPPNERLAAGKTKQVEKVQEAPTKKPETSSFLAMLQAEIEKVMPKTLGDTEKFMQGGSSGQMKGGLKGNVTQQKDQASGGVKSASKESPKEAGAAKDVQAIPPEGPTPAPAVNGAEGMPAPKAESEVSLQDSKQDVNEQIKQAEITDKHLADPLGKGVAASRAAVAKQADSAPAKFRTSEKGVLGQSGNAANANAKIGAAAMVGVKGAKNSAVLSKQQQAKARDEAKRLEVTTQIEGVYTETKKAVEDKLTSLDTVVGDIFDKGVDAAIQSMKDYVEDKIFKWKLDRYLLRVGGALLWAKDLLLGLPDEVKPFYEQGRNLFTRLMNILVTKVADLVERTLKEAKQLVSQGRAKIQGIIDKQPKELQAQLKEAQAKVSSDFDALEASVDDKKNQLAQQLAEKYKAAFERADKELETMQQENRGLVDKAVEAIGEVVKVLLEFKAKLMSLLKKGEDTIKLIIADPVGFLGNLIAAIKLGLNQFIGNIWAHIKKGFFAWLFGALAEAGIEIPGGLPSLPSILQLVLSVLGITYERMRAKAVKLIGERAVSVIETLVKYVKALIQGGPAALWEQIKSDLSDLKAMVIDAIQNYIVTTVAQRAIAKLVTLFNPVGAIVQAVLAIYDTVTFLIEKANQIMALVEAVINSVSAIASGAIGGAANWIEQALARTIPVVIGFLAQFVGLGKVSKKIKEFIQKVQAKVDAAIDKAIAKIVAVVKKLVGKLTGKKDKQDDKAEEGDVDPRMLAPLKKVEVVFSLGSSSHKMILDPEAKGVLKMASVAAPIEQKYAAAHAALDNWKRYLASIQDQEVRNKFEKHWKAEIDAIVAIQTGQYQEIYTKYYDEFAKRAQQAEKSGSRVKFKEGEVPPPQAPAQKFVKQATAQIKALIDRIRRWVILQKAGDFTPENIDKIISADGERIWKEQWEDRKKKVEAILKRHSSSVPGGGPIQYTGSLARGVRGPHKGRIRFNPDSFDVDAYIVSRDLHSTTLQAGGRTTAPRTTAKVLASSSIGGGEAGVLRGVVAKIRSELASVEGANAAKFDIHIRRNPL